MSEIVLLSSKLVTMLSQRPEARTVVPISAERSETATGPRAEVEFAPAELARAYQQWAERTARQGDYGQALVEAARPEIVFEFTQAQGLQLVVAAMPIEFEYAVERPTPPFAVKDSAGVQGFSMGVYSDSIKHGFGLTGPAHGIVTGSKYEVFDGGGLIDTVRGIVTNAVLDAAFLQLNHAATIAAPKGRSFLSGVAPNVQLQHEFDGAQSGLTQASVSGWVDDLLTVEPWLQNRVFTQRILQQRDSGSALIDANDRVLGFAFYNSSTFASPTLSAWIWADSVRQDFDLT